MSENKELSLGEKIVGIKFNPSELSSVDKIKRTFADIIDSLNYGTATYETEVIKNFAIQQCLIAQMAVVKCLTFDFPPIQKESE